MNDKLKNVIIIILTVVALLSAGTVGYLIAKKGVSKDETDKHQGNTQVENVQGTDEIQQNQQGEVENDDNCAKPSVPKCYGTYYGEANGTYANGISYNLKYTYVLKEDGTFTADFGGVSGTKGTFVINDNTISLTGIKDVAGPRDQDTHYSTGDYIIADDCSYILYDREINFKLFKK